MNFALLRFVATGIFNTGLYFFLYFLFSERFGFSYILAHIFASIFSMFCAYFLHVFFTFQTKPGILSFFLFPLSQLVTMFLQAGLLFVFVHWCGIPQQLAPFFVLGLLFPVTFRLTRTVIHWNIAP